jgi:3-oxoacyl-[acyl-carrier protein] reductase
LKNYLIIGASSGIGEAVAKQLKEEGNNVYSASRNEPTVETDGHITFDATEMESADFSTLPDTIDGIVYAAGTINLKPFNRLKPADYLKDLQINVLGAVHVIQENLKRLKKADSASIVLFSTVAGMSFHSSVSVAKGAIEGLTRSLAAELAASNIRVNAIAPSLTDTPLAGSLLSNEEKKESAGKRHPLGRVGTPADIAAMVMLLLSQNGSWITGQVIGIDGGMGSLK